MNREADRLLRAQGNRAGRQRMRADATLRPPKPPRGLIVSTGEDVTRGQSLRARLLVIEVSPGDIDWGTLGHCQVDAAKGLYAEALAGYSQWMAARYDSLQSGQAEELTELRQAATGSGTHMRTPEITANLALGLKRYLAFGQDIGALPNKRAKALWMRGWQALVDAAQAQDLHQAAAEPANRFIELLRAAISSGRAYVAGLDGGHPDVGERWEWRERASGSNNESTWVPQGPLAGWVDGENLYLESEASLAAVQDLAGRMGEGLLIGKRTLHKRLHERGWLVSTEKESRGTLSVRRNIAGARRNVLHLLASRVISHAMETDQPDQLVLRGMGEGYPGPVDRQRAGQLSIPPFLRTDHETDQGDPLAESLAGGEDSSSPRLVRLVEEGREAMLTMREGAQLSLPRRPCYACRCTHFWRSENGPWTCNICHPPADLSMVAVQFNLSDDGRRQ